jgi:hypothetical protein
MHDVRRALVPSALVLGMALTATGPARALSCEEREVQAPLPNAVDVPTNTRIWCSTLPWIESPQIVLEDASGGAIDGTASVLGTPGDYDLLVFQPGNELAPNTEYTVTCPIPKDIPGAYSFSTGAGPRHAPPRLPDVSNVRIMARENPEDGPTFGASFRDALEPGSLAVFDVGGAAALDSGGPAGALSDLRFVRTIAVDAWVGHGPCGGNWPGATFGASTTVRLGAFDLTGAFSGWSDTVTISLPAEREADSETEGTEPPAPDEASATPPSERSGARDLGCNLRPPSGPPLRAAALLSLALGVALRARRRPR